MTKSEITRRTIIIKDDLNFLENPNWVISNRNVPTRLVIKNEQGLYEVKNPEGLPVRFDKLVLYYLLHKLSDSELKFKNEEIITTRYEIAKNVLNQSKNFSKSKYDRIMLALKKWKAIYIKFEGTFVLGDHLTIKYFSIIDYVSLDKHTKMLTIKFNDQYIKQLSESQFYHMINFNDYKKLTKPISTRLYELIMKAFVNETVWRIDIIMLAEYLTLEKKAYVSQILVPIKVAVKDINKKTNKKFTFTFSKKKNICVFELFQ